MRNFGVMKRHVKDWVTRPPLQMPYTCEFEYKLSE